MPANSIFLMNSEPDNTCATAHGARTLTGLAVSRGVVLGPAYLFSVAGNKQVPEYHVEPDQVERELARLMDAFDLTRSQICALADEVRERITEDDAAIFDGHLMILDDPSFIGSCREKVSSGLRNAESAVKQVMEKYAAVFAAMDDAYLRERGQDIGDIAKRIIRNLSDEGDVSAMRVDRPCIVVADELSPSETISLPKDLILGLATDRGSTTSHASLLARALGLPAVVGLEGLSEIVKTGDMLLLDGTRGQVIVNPGQDERAAFENMAANMRSQEELSDQTETMPGQTADGRAVPFLMNADSSTPAENLRAAGVEGIGLYRSEYLWLRDNREPGEAEQALAYTAAAQGVAAGQPVTIRVLDLGRDKITKSKKPRKETNAFLGTRSIHYLLRHPEIFRRQLRAVLRASAFGNVRVMYPMIATVDDLQMANAELRVCMDQLRDEGVPFDESIQRGVMIETPAAALIADALARECDFFSIGTNDLIQYTLAVDRTDETAAHLYQPAHPAVLRLMELAVRAAHEHGLKVSVCGETAADPVMAVLFVGMGVDRLSMSSAFIRPVKRIIRQIAFADAEALVEAAHGMQDMPADKIYAFCREQVIRLVPDMLSCL